MAKGGRGGNFILIAHPGDQAIFLEAQEEVSQWTSVNCHWLDLSGHKVGTSRGCVPLTVAGVGR